MPSFQGPKLFLVLLALSSFIMALSVAEMHTTLAFMSSPSPQLRHLTVVTDKKSYGFGDFVEISGHVDQVTKGMTVRVDVYMSGGSVAYSKNGTLLSDMRIKPDYDALYSVKIQLPVGVPGGAWTASATYEGNTVDTNFTVR